MSLNPDKAPTKTIKRNPAELVRGDIIYLDFSPQSGHEQAESRPAIIVTPGVIDPFNPVFAMVVPITNQEKNYPFELPVPSGITLFNGRPLTGVALLDQAKTLDIISRNFKHKGHIPEESMFMQTILITLRSFLA